MSKEKPSPHHVVTDSGALHSEHAEFAQARSAADTANAKAKALGIGCTYEAVEGPYPFK